MDPVGFVHIHVAGFVIVDDAFFALKFEFCCAVEECRHMCAGYVIVWLVHAAWRCCCDAEFGECCDVAVVLVELDDVLEFDEVVVVDDYFIAECEYFCHLCTGKRLVRVEFVPVGEDAVFSECTDMVVCAMGRADILETRFECRRWFGVGGERDDFCGLGSGDGFVETIGSVRIAVDEAAFGDIVDGIMRPVCCWYVGERCCLCGWLG